MNLSLFVNATIYRATDGTSSALSTSKDRKWIAEWIAKNGIHAALFDPHSAHEVPGGNVERVGFYYRQFLQVTMIPTNSDSSLCFCGLQATSATSATVSPVSLAGLVPGHNSITGIRRGGRSLQAGSRLKCGQ